MGCTSSTAAKPDPSNVHKSDMGSRRGIGHTERVGNRSRKGIGHTERMGRTSKTAAAASRPSPQAAPDFDDEVDYVPELDDEGIMTDAEVARRTSSSAHSRSIELAAGGGGKDSIKVRYAFWTQRGYYPDGTYSLGGVRDEWASCIWLLAYYKYICPTASRVSLCVLLNSILHTGP